MDLHEHKATNDFDLIPSFKNVWFHNMVLVVITLFLTVSNVCL